MPILLLTSLVLTLAACSPTATDCSIDTFQVTTTEDISDGICNEHCTLREAVTAANTCSAYDLYAVDVPAGTYSLTLRGPGDNRGDLNILSSVSIFGVSPEETVIEGTSTWNNRIISVEEGAYLHLENLSIEGGNLDVGLGGGVLNRGILTVRNVDVINNKAMIGGGIFNAGNADLGRVRFVSNNAQSPAGLSDAETDLYLETELFDDCGGGFANSGDMVVNNTTIEQNNSGSGGGVCNSGSGVLTISNSTINNNHGSFFSNTGEGGGVFNSGDLKLENSTVTGNKAYRGGGIHMDGQWGDGFDYRESVRLSLDGVTVQANQTSPDGANEGGGLYLSGGEFNIQNSLILDNRSKEGGGIFMASTGVITHSTIARNSATDREGGGVYIAGDLEFLNVTISGNSAPLGGGAAMLAGGTARLKHVTLANNSTPGGGSFGGINTRGGRLIIGSTLMALNGTASCLVSRSVLDDGVGFNLCAEDGADLILSELTEDNGQLVHVLLPASPAIDQIPAGECLPDDQRGTERPQGDLELCDIGAYEFAPMVLSADPEIDLGLRPTLNTDVLCWEGPGPAYATVSSVLKGVEITLLGRDLDGEWWIIDNPRYPGVRCWLPEQSLDIPPDLDLTSLRTLVAPPIPTPIISGCLYQGPNDPTASCYQINKCPVPFDQSQGACIP